MLTASMLAAGLAALHFGAERLVRGGASLTERLGVTPLPVGLTVLARISRQLLKNAEPISWKSTLMRANTPE